MISTDHTAPSLRRCMQGGAALLLGALLLVAPPRVAGATAPPSSPPPAPTSMLVCDEPFHDFGTLAWGGISEHSFTLRNVGTHTVTLLRIHSSCGCLKGTADWTSVAPGETVAVAARMDTTGRAGQTRASLRVQTTARQSPYVLLRSTVEVPAPFDLTPSVVAFGRLRPDAAEERRLVLRGRAESLRPVEVVTDHDRITARIEPGSEAGESVIVVQTVPPLELGALMGAIHIRTDHAIMTALRVPVTGAVGSPIKVVPARLTLQGPTGRTLRRSLLVRPGTLREFAVLEVVPPDGVTADVTPLSDAGCRITLSGLKVERGLIYAPVRIFTSSEELPEIEVPITVLAEP